MSELLNKFNPIAAQGFRHHFDGSVEEIAPSHSASLNPDLAVENEVGPLKAFDHDAPGL